MKKNNKFIFGLIVLLLLFAIFLFANVSDFKFISILSLIIIVLSVLTYILSYKAIDIVVIFSVFAWLFSLSSPSLELFDLSVKNSLLNSYSIPIIVDAIRFVTLSILSFILISYLVKYKILNNRKKSSFFPSFSNDALNKIGLILTLVGLIPMTLYVFNCLRYTNINGYGGGIYKDGVINNSSFFYSLRNYFIYGIFITLVTSKNNIKRGRRFLLYGVVYCVCMIVVGQRITLVTLMIGFLFCYHYGVENLKKYRFLIITSCIILILILPVMSSFRVLARSKWSLSTIFAAINFQEGIISLFEECGSSFTVLLNCMNGTAINGGTLHGASFVHTFFLSFLPSSLVKLIYNPGYSSLQTYYTSIVAPETYQIGGGLGFSLFAEAYVNFGKMGWMYFLLFGAGYSYLYNKSYCLFKQGNSVYFALGLFLCQRLIFITRSDTYDFYGNVKMLIILFVIIYLLNLVVKRPKHFYEKNCVNC